MAILEVIDGGILSTVQDLGRPAAARYAVPPGGAMDAFALEAANRLVGNPPGAAAIEITGGGAAFRVLAPAALAITGADLAPVLNRAPCPAWTAVLAPAGSVLEFAGRRGEWGARACLAVAGGIAVPEVLASASTYLPGGFGGHAGRALQAGDTLAGRPPRCPELIAGCRWRGEARPAYGRQPALRVIPGPHAGFFDPPAGAGLFDQVFRIGAQSNRMGYRLEGTPLAPPRDGANLPSLGVVAGAVQVPPDGAPILLMADAQTTGGYPIAGVVIRADLPLAAQLLPGDGLRFTPATEAEAVAAWRLQRAWLEQGLVPALPDDVREALLWAGSFL